MLDLLTSFLCPCLMIYSLCVLRFSNADILGVVFWMWALTRKYSRELMGQYLDSECRRARYFRGGKWLLWCIVFVVVLYIPQVLICWSGLINQLQRSCYDYFWDWNDRFNHIRNITLHVVGICWRYAKAWNLFRIGRCRMKVIELGHGVNMLTMQHGRIRHWM